MLENGWQFVMINAGMVVNADVAVPRTRFLPGFLNQ